MNDDHEDARSGDVSLEGDGGSVGGRTGPDDGGASSGDVSLEGDGGSVGGSGDVLAAADEADAPPDEAGGDFEAPYEEGDDGDEVSSRREEMDEEADYAADFIEGVLDILDLPGDIEIRVSEEEALVTVQDIGSGLLIGRRGATLEALQELVRGAVQRQTARRSHVRVDIEGYRARQLEKLRDKCRDAIAEVRESGQPVKLEPMDAFERKMMHNLVAASKGVSSASEGAEPRRRVVIHPAD